MRQARASATEKHHGSVGIDFGTSTSLVAYRPQGGEARTLPIGRATPWLPSVVGLTEQGRLVAGEDALALPVQRQLRSVKSRLIEGVEQLMVDGEVVATRDAVHAILAELVQRAQTLQPGMLDGSRVYLGCPALWTGRERRLLADVAHEVGLDVDIPDVIDEPVAAGLHTVHQRWLAGRRTSGRTVVFDAGGGTLDIAYLDVVGADHPEFTVMSAEGVPRSGDALDRAIVADLSHLIDRCEPAAAARLLLNLRATELKELLSFADRRELALGGSFEVLLRYSRAELENAFAHQLSDAERLTRSVVRGAQLRVAQQLSPTEIRQLDWQPLADEIAFVSLTGGMAQVPIVQRRLAALFPRAEIEVVDRPQEAVVLGLARGDELDRLSLPRPPVDFVVEYGPPELIRRLGLEEWAEANRSVYEAFTPLYSPHEVILGNSMLRYQLVLPVPPGCRHRLEVRIRGVSPERGGHPLTFRVVGRHAATGEAVTVTHDQHRPARFNLYANGDLLVSGSRGEAYRFRVARWPRLRGAAHDWSREIQLEQHGDEPYVSALRYDDWRFQ